MADAKFINLYENQAGYDAEIHGINGSEVSLIEDVNKVVYDSVNVEIPEGIVPDVGTALWVDDNGGKHFFEGKSVDAAKLTEQGLTFVGAVACRKGRRVKIIYKNQSSAIFFVSCFAWEIKGVTIGSENTIVFQQTAKTSPYDLVTVGTCTFTPSDIDDAIAKIDAWLDENPGDTSTCFEYKWHCEKIDGKIYVIADFALGNTRYNVSNVMYGSTKQIVNTTGSSAGITSDNNMFNLSGMTENSDVVLRNDGVDTTFGVYNKSRVRQYNTNIGTPTDSLTTKFIYSFGNFTQANCPNVYAAYGGDYDKYLDAMSLKYPVSSGAVKTYCNTAKDSTHRMNSITYTPKGGTEPVKMFTAAAYPASVNAKDGVDVDGLNAGDWYLPSIKDSNDVFSKMNVDGSDPISTALVKSGAAAYNLVQQRWCNARLDYRTAWILFSGGVTSNHGNGFLATDIRAVAIADLDF